MEPIDVSDAFGARYSGSDNMIVDLLTKILGAVSGGNSTGGMLAQLGTPLLKTITGPGIWDSFGSTNMTGEGVFNQRLQSRLNEMANRVSSNYGTEYTRAAMRDVSKTLVSYDTWQSRPGNELKTPDDWNAYIDSQVQYISSIPFATNIFGAVSKMAGMGDPAVTGRNLADTARNLARGGMLRGDRNAMMFGSQLASGLFGGRFDSEMWGGMSSDGVSGVAAAISKDVDFLRDINPVDSDQLSTAVGRFRDMVHMYTEALAPLKDVFGNDIRGMLTELERLSGQTLGQMDVDRLKGLSMEMSTRVNAGSYGIRDMASMSQMVRGAISGMPGLGPYVYTSTAEQSITALDMYRTGVKPDYLTDSQWRDSAIAFTTQTAGSGGTELFAQTYALWSRNERSSSPAIQALEARRDAERAELEGRDDTSQADINELYARYDRMIGDTLTFADFEQAVVAEAGSGDKRTAAMRLAGVSNAAEAAAGWGQPEYRRAIESGQAARMSRQSLLEWRTEQAALLSGLDIGFINALGFAGDDRSKQAQNWFRNVISLVDTSPEMLNLPDRERATRLREMGKTDETEIARYNLAFNYMKRSPATNGLLTLINLAGNERQQVENAERARRRRERLQGAEGRLFSEGGILKDMLRDGWTDARLHDKLLASSVIDRDGTDTADMLPIISSAGLQADILAGGDAASARMRANRFMTYALSSEGLGSKGFNQELHRYSVELAKNYTEDGTADKDALEQSSLIMSAYMDVSADAVDRFLDAGTDRDAQRKKLADYMRQSRASSNPKPLRTAIQEGMLEIGLDALSADERAVAAQFRAEYSAGNGLQLGVKGWEKDWADYYKTKSASLQASGDSSSEEQHRVLSQLDRMMESAASGITNKPQGADLFEKLIGVLERLDATLKVHDADAGNVSSWVTRGDRVERTRGR